MPAKKIRGLSCRWKGCNQLPVAGSVFCGMHTVVPEASAFPKWIKELPFAIGTGLASSLLFELLKYFYEHASFHDNTANKVKGMMSRLQVQALADVAIPEVADFIEATHDPYFARDMQKIVTESGKHDLC